jgi:hypothetical protein
LWVPPTFTSPVAGITGLDTMQSLRGLVLCVFITVLPIYEAEVRNVLKGKFKGQPPTLCFKQQWLKYDLNSKNKK